MPRILLATSNQHKLIEMRALLGDIAYDLITPSDINLHIEVDEPYLTYIENARHKAQSYADASGLLALADDSGLEIDALHGEPGVLSARFAGPDATYADRFALLAERLQATPEAQRTARFRCVMALAAPNKGPLHTTDGSIAGLIVFPPRGQQGFGYDPIFLLPDQQRVMAELTAAEKDAISHRSIAARAMGDYLRMYQETPIL